MLQWALKIIKINSSEVVISKSSMVESNGHFQANIQKYVVLGARATLVYITQGHNKMTV